MAEDDVLLAVAECVLICAERAEGHRRTLAAGSGDAIRLEAAAREADRCAAALTDGRAHGGPQTVLAEVRATLLDERDRLRLERDRANQAYTELHTSHRVLTSVRDLNSTDLMRQRDRLIAAREKLVELRTWISLSPIVAEYAPLMHRLAELEALIA